MEEQNASLEKLISEIDQPFWRAAAEARLLELRAEVERLKAINEEISSISDKWRGELNGAEQALAGALLQNSELIDALADIHRDATIHDLDPMLAQRVRNRSLVVAQYIENRKEGS